MNSVEILARQTEDAYAWAHKLIDGIPQAKWEDIPEVIESSVSWQMGHLLVSYYYHTVMSIVGHQMSILSQVPIKEYSDRYSDASPRLSSGTSDLQTLRNHLTFVGEQSLQIIRALPLEELEQPLNPASLPHPIANTKFEALDWSVKHTMWHCGQLGILKRILDKRYDFGLEKK